MTISHQIVTDADGNPVAAQIPWDEFQVIRAELERPDDAPLSAEWKAELDRRVQRIKDGSSRGIPHDEVMEKVRARIARLREDEQQSA